MSICPGLARANLPDDEKQESSASRVLVLLASESGEDIRNATLKPTCDGTGGAEGGNDPLKLAVAALDLLSIG